MTPPVRMGLIGGVCLTSNQKQIYIYIFYSFGLDGLISFIIQEDKKDIKKNSLLN